MEDFTPVASSKCCNGILAGERRNWLWNSQITISFFFFNAEIIFYVTDQHSRCRTLIWGGPLMILKLTTTPTSNNFKAALWRNPPKWNSNEQITKDDNKLIWNTIKWFVMQSGSIRQIKQNLWKSFSCIPGDVWVGMNHVQGIHCGSTGKELWSEGHRCLSGWQPKDRLVDIRGEGRCQAEEAGLAGLVGWEVSRSS